MIRLEQKLRDFICSNILAIIRAIHRNGKDKAIANIKEKFPKENPSKVAEISSEIFEEWELSKVKT